MRLSTRRGKAKLLVGLPLILGAAGTGVIATTVHGAAGSTCTGTVHPANATGSIEALLADLSPPSGSSVQPGSTIQLLYTDEQPMASSTTTVASPTVTIDGQPVTPTVTPTSGVTPNYIQPSDGGSKGTQCQDQISFTVPSNISGGTHTANVTGYDSDNNRESVSFTFTTPTPTPPPSPTPSPPGIITSQTILPNDEGFVVNGQEATGTMTFNLYRPGDDHCTKAPVFSETDDVSNGLAMTSNTSHVFTQPGAYRWLVTYSGDETHPRAVSPCGTEVFRIQNNNTQNS
jgi:hypothetical protein